MEKEIDILIETTATSKESDSRSTYRYTPEQIEEFFDSDSGQKEDHILEDSIFKPLIGIQNNTPNFFYCKLDPKVENIHLKSIEDHIRLKDPQRHKANLLELLGLSHNKEEEKINKNEM